MEKKLKVLIVISVLASGGAERFCLDLAKHLDRERLDVTLLSTYPRSETSPAYQKEVEEAGYRMEFYEGRKGTRLRTLRFMIRYLRQHKPDVVHSNISAGFLCACALFFARVPVHVFTVHNPMRKPRNIYVRLGYPLYRFSTRHMGMVPVAISKAVIPSISQRLRLPPEKIPLIYNGIDTRRFTPGERRRGEGDPFRFVMVARLNVQKNPQLAVTAFARVARTENATLTFVGEGDLRAELEALADKLGVADRVIFAGVVGDVPAVLRQCDAFVFSSDYEGFGLALTEAMACGLPVVSTDTEGPSEIFEDGTSGFLTPIGDADALAEKMLLLARSPDLCRSVGEAAREAAQRFSIQRMADEYEALYRALYEKKKKK